MRTRSRIGFWVHAVLLTGACALAGAAEQPKIKAVPFELNQVQLLDSPFKHAQELDARYMLSLDADRLLHVFRVNAGLPSTAEPLGGWESPDCELRGHFVGHYLSGCSLMYKTTGDERFKQRVDYIVAELAKCQEKIGTGYLSAFPPSLFDRLEAGKPVWAPYYTIHKIMAGLLDANQLCGNKQALDVDNAMAAYFKSRIDKLDDQQMAVVMRNEFGGMMEVLANLSAVTGNADQLALAKRFDHHAVFDPLAKRQDKLSGLHVNTQIPKMIGAARIYELTGEERYHTVPDYFWTEVTEHRSFVTGSNSFGEMFQKLGVEANDLVPNTAETCNIYNMLKLTRHLFEWNPSALYADYYERALYNHILASIDPDSGMTMYYLSLKPGHFKVYGTPTDSFWCCNGTGVENHAKYGDSIYFHNDNSLWLNLFIPSELTWKEKGIVLRQETTFPKQDTTTLAFKAAQPTKLTLQVRVPYWATNGIGVKINGEEQRYAQSPAPQSYLPLDRTWNDGDKVEITLPMNLHLYHAIDDPSSVAIMYGPIVLAGELGRENFPKSDQARGQSDLSGDHVPRVPRLVSDTDDLNSWIKPVPGEDLAFATVNAGKPNDVNLIPLYALHHQRYTVYWKLLTTQQYAELAQKREQEDAAKKAEAARVVDAVDFGSEHGTNQHNAEGETAGVGQFMDRYWRHATGGGWFGWQLKTIPDVPQVVRCTYWGSDAGGREFDILIDGHKIATQTLDNNKPGEFFNVDYAIPQELLKGKESVFVRFQAHEHKTAGGVFGCAIVKAK
jgi:uncharacterized protein